MPREIRLAASYGELGEPLQQRIEIVMRFFLALGEPVDAPTAEASQQAVPLEEQTTRAMDASFDAASIFGMGRS